MAQFNNLSITNSGKNLYAKAQAGTQLRFTKMQIGSGLIGTQNPETLLALIDAKYDIGIQSITPNTESKTATISGMINNDNVADSIYICEIGLFAQDPDAGEILYAYGSAGSYGDWLASSTNGAYSWNYQIIAAVGNASNVTVNLSNLSYDYGLVNTATTFTYIVGGNQKEINTSIDNLFKLYTTSNAGNIYSLSVSNISNLKDGYPLRVKFNAASTGPTSLKINSLTAKPIKDYFGNTVTNIPRNLIANLAYEISSDSFILQGKGGGGNATADKMLSPYTATTDAGQITGTIPSKGAQTYAPSTVDQIINSGQYLAGNQVIKGAKPSDVGGYGINDYVKSNNIMRDISASLSIPLSTSGKDGSYTWSYANSLIVNNNYCYVVNYGSLQKIDQNGNLIWSKSLPTPTIATPSSDIKSDNNGNIILFFSSRLLKYDVNGNLLWTVDITDLPTEKQIRDIEIDNNGNIFMAYYWYQASTGNYAIRKINSSGQQVWDKVMNFIRLTTDGDNLYVYGSTGQYNYIKKLDANGNEIKNQQSFPPCGNGIVYSNNVIYCTDSYNPNSGGYWNNIAKIDTNLSTLSGADNSTLYGDSTLYFGCFSKDGKYLYITFSRLTTSGAYIKKLSTSNLLEEWTYPIGCDQHIGIDDYNNLWVRTGDTLLKLTESYKILG
ncbi:hypothetical protein [Clostridium saccharoperbutylacetonicum]|uniref:hypothetical protein n=1 Tax=Clostridium saccharoperbutylacetonicum TaxID=36745 RepID=UPI0039E75A08